MKIHLAGAKGFSDTYEQLMLSKYNIEIIKTGFFGLPEHMHCYNSFSVPFVTEKFGDTIFTQTKIEANLMDKSGKGDRMAKFKPKQDSLIAAFIYQRLNPTFYKDYLKYDSRENLDIYCQIFTDSTGKAINLYQSALKGRPIDSALKVLVKELPFYTIPALNDGVPSEGMIQMYLRFNKNTINAYDPKLAEK